MVTIAVEKPGALESVRLMAERGVVPALGHSNCTYEEAVAAIDAGVTGATHLFNAMPGLHHRTPGPILALLEDDRVWCELIVDGVHLRPELAAWVMSVSDRIVLVTDGLDHWLADLHALEARLPPLGERSWRVEIFDRCVGYLGEYRRSRVTGRWFLGKHSVHLRGHPGHE